MVESGIGRQLHGDRQRPLRVVRQVGRRTSLRPSLWSAQLAGSIPDLTECCSCTGAEFAVVRTYQAFRSVAEGYEKLEKGGSGRTVGRSRL